MTEKSRVACVFPGQGSQSVGMGKDLYDGYATARAIFKEADEVLGLALSRLSFEGPEDELQLTVNAQPALVTVSYAILRIIQEVSDGSFPEPAYLAGHSLGEYTALAAAGVLDFATTVRLARERGRLMYEAGQQSAGAMVAVIGLDEATLTEVCRQTNTCIANYNSPAQLVISGAMEDMPRAVELAQNSGASRVVPLQVSGAFHSPLMKPAQEGLSKILATIKFKDPTTPIIGNTTARPLTDAGAIKQELTDQLCNGVQWQRSVEYMIDNGVSTFIEIGPGRVLSGLIRRINKDIGTRNIGDAEAIKNINTE